MTTVTFHPKMDWWLPTLICGAMGIATLMTLLDPEGGPYVVTLVIVLDILILWMFSGSRYRLGESELRVVFGPLRLTYPLKDVVLVRKGRWWAQVSSFREPRVRLAFSTNNLIVESSRNGRPGRVVISPRDSQEFLRLLQERSPQVRVEGF